jgi:hypothetical protein
MYLRGETGENPPGSVIVSLSISILREAGTGIEPVNSAARRISRLQLPISAREPEKGLSKSNQEEWLLRKTGIAAPQGSFKRLRSCPYGSDCPECSAIGWSNQSPVVTKDHLWGISHLGSNGVFVFGESVEIGAE